MNHKVYWRNVLDLIGSFLGRDAQVVASLPILGLWQVQGNGNQRPPSQDDLVDVDGHVDVLEGTGAQFLTLLGVDGAGRNPGLQHEVDGRIPVLGTLMKEGDEALTMTLNTGSLTQGPDGSLRIELVIGNDLASLARSPRSNPRKAPCPACWAGTSRSEKSKLAAPPASSWISRRSASNPTFSTQTS